MPDRTHAAVELDGTTLRFAEVHPERRELLRLGRILLDFDARTALDHAGEEREALGEALAQAFAGATPAHLTVALHPAGLTVWSAALDPSDDADARRARLRYEAGLLTGKDEADLPLHVIPLYDDGQHAWQLVMALPKAWAEAVRSFDTRVGGGDVRLVPTALGAVRAQGNGSGSVLAVGIYEHVTELALMAGGAVRLVGHAPTGDPADAAFTTLSLLTHAGSAPAVETLVLYGPGADDRAASAFEGALGTSARPLDPFGTLRFAGASPEGAGIFAPVIGAALG